jgi:3-deoxy-D-manno-octulosonic acid (KDO) 8-phosphate synthase
VNLSGCVSCTIKDSQGVGTIQNDDSPPPPSISINDVSSREGDGGTKDFVFTITRAGVTTGTSSVKYATAAGTAASPSDYVAKSGTISFSSDETTETIKILVSGDTTYEPNQTFSVNLSGCVSCTIKDSQGVGTIQNDDSPPPPSISINDVSMPEGNSGTKNFVFTVTRSGITAGTSSVNYATSMGTAASPSDYAPILLTTLSFAAGEVKKTLTIPVHGDTIAEPNETFFVNLSDCIDCTIADSQGVGAIQNEDAPSPAATISINDVATTEGNSGTKNFVFTITRAGVTTGTSSVKYATSVGTATVADADFVADAGTISFAANELTKTVTIVVNGDSAFEPNETFFVNLSDCVSCTIKDSQGVGAIVNDESEQPEPTISMNDVSMPEGDSGTKNFVFTVTRSGITAGTSSVNYATSMGTAASSNDYIALSTNTLKFAANEARKTVSVVVNGDITTEPNETFFVTLSNCINCTISDSQGAGTIQNDDLQLADTDGDGIPDSGDRCPNQRGSQTNNGCPATTSVEGSGQPNNPFSFFGPGGFINPYWILAAVIAIAAVKIVFYLKGKLSIKFVKS